MRLLQWLREREKSLAEVGRACGVPRRQTMFKYAHGLRRAPPELIAAVHRFTDGAVTTEDWIFTDDSVEPVAGAA